MRRNRPTGFTLVELMVSMAIVSMVVMAISGVVTAQQRIFRNNEQLRLSDENAQLATVALSRAIRLAGFGMDPELGIDFENYKCENLAAGVARTALCTNGQRESKANAADELVVYYRNPNYRVGTTTGALPIGQAWATDVGTSSSNLKLKGGTATNLRKGQILLVACPNASVYTYVTLGADGTEPGNAIPLDTSSSDAFHQQGYIAAYNCLQQDAVVFRIERERYFVARFQDHPYLMLDTGTDVNGDGALDDKDAIPIASDIADLQVAYQFAQDPAGVVPLIDKSSATANSVLFDALDEGGIAPPTAQVLPGGCPDVVAPYYRDRCFFERRTLDPARFGPNPANIVNVRVGLAVRTALPDEALRTFQKNASIPRLLNRDVVAASSNLNGSCGAANSTCDGYRFTIIQLAESTPNLASRALFLW